MDNKYLYCTIRDFQEFIEDLPDNATIIRTAANPVEFPFGDDNLILDCESVMWVRGPRRKYCRKVLYAYFSIKIPEYREDYVIYYVTDEEPVLVK